MKKLYIPIAAAAVIVGLFAFTNRNTAAVAYSPPPASNIFAIMNGMRLTISLPPEQLITPARLHIAGEHFGFNTATKEFILETAPSDLRVTARYVTNPTFPQRNYYEVVIRGFQLGQGGQAKLTPEQWMDKLQLSITAEANTPPPAGTNICLLFGCEAGRYNPYEYKMTAAQLTRATAKSFGDFLKASPTANDINTVFLSNRTCSVVNTSSGTTLCMKTVAQLNAPGFSPVRHTLIQSIPVFGGVTLEGNVAGAGTITGFSFDDSAPKAIAVGGQVIGVLGGAGNNPVNYTASSTQLKWDGPVKAQMLGLFANNKAKATTVSNPQPLAGGRIVLNSGSTSVRNPNTTTLSSPPEGKLWLINSDATFTNVTMEGVGTILVEGNVTINGQLQCSTSTPTRFGIIATGSITFNLATANGKVQCGAYTALNGDIAFGGAALSDPEVPYEARGIFVASQSVKLPVIADDVAFKIKYDTVFANEPTILFKELLKIAFSTVS